MLKIHAVFQAFKNDTHEDIVLNYLISAYFEKKNVHTTNFSAYYMRIFFN